jgi:A/G-specific adenine glycosylase
LEQQVLLEWYHREARALPWRATRDPYAILVSEIMLQQTQAARVEPAYRAFLARFPAVAVLAAAPLADVLTQWRGLGYNRRARNLHAAAAAIVERHGGVVPRDLAALRALPGLGDYTARAVLAFAFDEPAAPVDTNVGRVLARAAAGEPLTRAAAQRLADALVPAPAPAAWSHALMDLGARVCVARRPRCGLCPVAASCAWLRRGGDDPAASTATRSRPQAAFAGSDRYHRGRLVDALRAGPLPASDLPGASSLADPGRLERLVARLVAEGLAEWHDDRLRLPG